MSLYNKPKQVRAPRKTGLPPGTLIHRGTQKTAKSQLELLQYSQEELIHHTVQHVSQLDKLLRPGFCHWINLDGLHNVKIIEGLGKRFSLNPMMLEDILNTEQRPKFESVGDIVFFPMKMLYINSEKSFVTEQFSLVLGDDFLLSFREQENNYFDHLLDRIKDPTSKIRHKKNNYLFYRLVDTVVDNYFVVLDSVSDDVEAIEEEVYFKPTDNTLKRIQSVKKELINIRRTLYPMREAILKIKQTEHPILDETTVIYFDDVLDHIKILIDSYESSRDMVANLMDTYMTMISNRMNEIMKVLTIISTIFIPLSFVAGVYGMNFNYMPELAWKYGYFIVLGIMFLMIILMLRYFRRRHWI